MHVFTSPHLINITERIQIAGKIISKKYFELLLAECIKINDREELSFFELITAVAFLAFSKNKAEWTILEVGLGGRLDSTNVIESTHLSIITPIAMDHQEFLGNNIKKISLEKGGIIKENSNLIISKQPSSALKVLKKISKNKNCDTTIYGRDFKNKKNNKSFLYSTNEKKIVLPSIPVKIVKCLPSGMSELFLFDQKVSCDKLLKNGFTFKYGNLEIALKNLLNKL